MRKQQRRRNKKDARIVTRQEGIRERGALTAVVAVIQRPETETTTPTATTERKRKAAVVLDSAAASTVRIRQSAAAGAAVAMAASSRGRDGDFSRPGCAKAEERQTMLRLLLKDRRVD